jgi:ubiquinone/menaquinone biosynthesis C-methylase UbiE
VTTSHEPYLKAAGTDRLAPYYDLMARIGMRERHIKGRVIEQAQLVAGGRMLDLGCGTGTLVLMAWRRHPDATVIGLDGDPTILAIARRKARQAGIPAQLDEGMAYALPYEDGSFDAVVSTLTFHHLTPDQQQRALSEVQRVLRPGARLVIADLAEPHNHLMRLLRHLPFGLLGRHCRHRVSHHAHEGMDVEHPAAPTAQAGGHIEPDTPSGREPRAMTMLEYLLTTNRWRSVAATERYMSVIGTIAVHTLEPP